MTCVVPQGHSRVVRTLVMHSVLSAQVLLAIKLNMKEVKIATVIFLSGCSKEILRAELLKLCLPLFSLIFLYV